MATTKQINQYTAASTIDPVNDQLLIDPGGTGAYNKINRNTLLGITGSPIGSSDTQTLTNKTIGNTNTITVKDGSFTLNNSSDTTKVGVFSLANNTTGTTRTYTMPNASVTLASLSGTETLTNKTITSPAITGGTIANSTITVDSIAGYSTSTIVTVANLQISNGVLNSAGAVTSTSIAAGAIQPQALVSGTGTGWTWQTWTPTITNMSGGTNTTAIYIQTGKTVHFRFVYTLAGAGISGAPTFTLPVTASSNYSDGFEEAIGWASFVESGTGIFYGVTWLSSTTIGTTYVINTSNTYAVPTAISSTVPFTWGNTHKFVATGTYQAA